MEFTIGKIELVENVNTPKVEVQVLFKSGEKNFAQKGNVLVYLDWRDYTISEIKTEATRKAKEFLGQN